MTATKVTSGVIASGVIPDPSGWEFVSVATASASATIAFTGFETGYDYMVTGSGNSPATDNVLFNILLGVTGPTYRTSNYFGSSSSVSGAGSSYGNQITTAITNAPNTQGNAADETAPFYLVILDPASATDTYYYGIGSTHQSTTVFFTTSTAGHHGTAEAMTAIKFSYASGNIASGIFKLYQRPNA